MKRTIVGLVGGMCAGVCCAFLALCILAPMGGSLIKVAALPFLLGPALLGALTTQSLLLAVRR